MGHAVRDHLRAAQHGLRERPLLARLHGALGPPPSPAAGLASPAPARRRAAAQIPPSIGLYFLWVKVIYPWISKPDEEEPSAMDAKQNTKIKYGKGR